MIIDNQIDGLTCDIAGNFLDIYLDENNNSFSNIDNLPTPTTSNQTTLSSTKINLPQSIFSFKSNLMQCIDCKLKIDENKDNLGNEKMELNNSKLSHQKLTIQSVKRALFVEKDKIDHEANLKLVRKQMEQLEKQDCEKWNFDFKNNCPLNNLNSRYEWFKANSINEPVLGKLDLNQKDNLKSSSSDLNKNGSSTNNLDFKKIDKKTELSNAVLQVSSSSACEFENTSIGNRSIKRKLNINDYFQPTKKHVPNLSKDQTPTKSTDLLPTNKTVKYVQTEIKITETNTSRSIKLQKNKESLKQPLKRKCKKSTPQKQRTRQKKSLEKVTKRQTTLKF